MPYRHDRDALESRLRALEAELAELDTRAQELRGLNARRRRLRGDVELLERLLEYDRTLVGPRRGLRVVAAAIIVMMSVTTALHLVRRSAPPAESPAPPAAISAPEPLRFIEVKFVHSDELEPPPPRARCSHGFLDLD